MELFKPSEIGTVFDWKSSALFALWFLGTLLLFLPDPLAHTFGVDVLRSSYRPWIGLGTLFFFVVWIAELSASWAAHRKDEKEASATREAIIKNLDSLSAPEAILVMCCLHDKQRTINRNIADPVVNSLCHKGILERANIGHTWYFPFTFRDFVWEHLLARENQYLPKTVITDSRFTEALNKMRIENASRTP